MILFKNISAAIILAALLIVACSGDHDVPLLDQGFITGADSSKIYYKVMGSGQDSIVVIHGGPGAGMNSFMPSVKPLARDYILIFYDQRGGGKSTLPEDTTKLQPQHFVEDLEAVRKYFGLKSMNVITHSFGSVLLAEYAISYPENLKRVVFNGSTGPVRSEMARYYQSKAQQTTSAVSDTSLTNKASDLLSSLLKGTAEDPIATCHEYERISLKIALARGDNVNFKGTSCDAPAEAIHYYYRYTAQLAPNYFGRWDYTNKLDSFIAPLLVLYGAEDSLAIPSQQTWTAITPNSKLLLVPDAEKGTFSDNPEFVFPAVKEFFEGSWPEQAE